MHRVNTAPMKKIFFTFIAVCVALAAHAIDEEPGSEDPTGGSTVSESPTGKVIYTTTFSDWSSQSVPSGEQTVISDTMTFTLSGVKVVPSEMPSQITSGEMSIGYIQPYSSATMSQAYIQTSFLSYVSYISYTHASTLSQSGWGVASSQNGVDWKTLSETRCQQNSASTKGLPLAPENRSHIMLRWYPLTSDGTSTNTYLTDITIYGEELPTVALAGTMNGWDYTTQTFTPSDDNQTASLTIALAADTYEFKIVEDGNWLGKTGGDGEYYTLHRDWPTAYELENSDGAGNILLTADAAGEYTFIWTYSTKNLQVVFPGQTPSTDQSYYLIGNTEQLGAWSLENALPMESGAITLNLPAGTYSFKVLPQNDGWDGALGYNNLNSGCSSENITTDVDGNLVVTFSEAGELHVSVADGLLCVTGTFSYTSEFVNFTVDVTPEGSGYVYPTSGSYQRGSTLSLEASISTGGWMFDRWSDNGAWDNPRSLYLTQDTTVTAIFSPGEYGILINGNRLVRGTFTERLNGSYIAQFRASASLSAGDQIKIINLFHGNNSSWRPELEEGGSSESFSVGDAELICNQAGCYDIYMKIAYGQSSDYVYIGGGTDCSTGEPFGTGDIYVYSVVGTANLFGTAWDKADTKTEMTLQGESMYAYTIDSIALYPDSVYEYKVISNHEWNVQEWPNFEENYNLSVEEPGVYQVLFMLNPGTGCTATTNYLHAIQDEQPCGIIASGECGADGANVTWLLTCDSILTIGGDGRMADYNEETTIAPWYEYRDAYHSVYIAAGVLNVGDLAFRESPNLRYVDLASTVVSLGNYSFYNCPNLHSLTLPESVTTLSDNTPFGGTTTMTNPVLNSSVFVRLPENYAGEYTVAEGTTVIASHAFYGCNQLTSLVLPNTVHILSGSSVFENCTMLVSVNIPEGVTALGEFTFSNCSSLKAIDLPSTLASLGSYCFSECWMIESITCRATTPPEANGSSLSGVNYMIPIYVPAGTAEIYKAADGWSGFTDYRDIIDGCVIASGECGADGNNLTWEVSCDTILTIKGIGEMEDFDSGTPWDETEYWGSSQPIIIEEGVTNIGYGAFSPSNTYSVSLPTSLLKIGGYAFGPNARLRTIVIPQNVTSIDEEAFVECYYLDSIYVDERNTTYDSRNDCNAIIETATNTLVVGGGITIIPSEITTIGAHAFEGRSSLNSIDLPVNLNSIGESAFWNTSISSISIPDHVTNIGEKAFSGCPLISIALPQGIKQIQNNIFEYCSKLTTVILGDSVESLGNNSFYDCKSLTSINLPKTLTSIGSLTFSSCKNLTNIFIPDNVTNIGSFAFQECSGLTSLTIPSKVTSIGNSAFSGCTGLTSVTNHSITPQTISKYVFNNVDKSIPLYVPAESIELYQAADGWKEFTNIQAIEGDSSVVVDSTTVYFLNTLGWDKVGVWVDNEYQNWPGGLAKKTEYTLNGGYMYSYTIPSSYYQVMFNNGQEGEGMHTELLTINPERPYFVPKDHISGSNSYSGTWYASFEEIPVEETITLYFINSLGWDTVGAYVWIENSQNFIEWPGAKATKLPEQVNGNDLYSYTFPSKYINIIFNNFITEEYNSAQTYDLTWSADKPYFSPIIESYDGYRCYGTWLSAVPCNIASGTCGAQGDNLTWSLSCDSVLTIRGTGAMANYSVNSDGQAPWAEHGLEIRDIVIEEGVRTIGAYAFYNAGSYTNGAYNNVRSVTIPNTVTKLQNNYFYQCPIQTVTLNSDSIVGQTTYSSNASLHKMFGAQVRQYIIGDSVKSIAGSVFYNQSADSLKSILLPEGLTSIGSWAFGYLENLDSITLPSGLLSIGSDAFYGSGLRAVTIPGSVTEMGGQAFQNCDKLASVILEEGLKTLGTSAFQNCTSLTEITIPESMVTISSGAFTDCTHLTKMTILATEWVGADKSSSSTTKLAIGNYVRELILGDQIPTIGKYAFSSLDSLRTVTLPFNVTSISSYAFSSCPSLACVISNALTPPTIQSTTFSRQDTLIVPCESKQLYKTAQYWQNFNRIRCADDREMSISLTGSWTFIMLPSAFGMEAGDVTTEGEVQWGTYNGSTRAMGRSGWENYSAEAVYMCSQALIVRATGEAATLHINVPTNATAMAGTTVSLIPNAAALPQNANWCFAGNPYPYGYLLNGLAAQGITSPIAVWNGTGYDTYTPGIDDYIIPAFGAFFIQLPEGTTEPTVINFSAEYIYM